MKGYHVYSKIQHFRTAGFSQRQVARRLGINRKTGKGYWEMPVKEYAVHSDVPRGGPGEQRED